MGNCLFQWKFWLSFACSNFPNPRFPLIPNPLCCCILLLYYVAGTNNTRAHVVQLVYLNSKEAYKSNPSLALEYSYLSPTVNVIN